MPKPNIYRTLINKAGLGTMIWATLQQAVVASSTYFIVAAIRASTDADYEAAITWVLLFVASLIVVFIPNTCSVIWLQRWRFDSMSAFVKEFISFNAGRTTWAHSREKNKYEAWLTTESGVVFENVTQTLYDLYQLFLSTVLTILVIALVIDPRISVWYIFAGIVLAISNRMFRGRIGKAAQELQSGRRDFSGVLLSGWENIFMGNRHTLSNWEKRFHQTLKGAKDAAAGYDRTRALVSSFAVTLALIVIALGNGVFLNEQRSNPGALAALIVTLPRQLHVIQNIFAFFGYILSWEGLRAQLKELEGILILSKTDRDLTGFVKLAEISVSNADENLRYESFSDLTADLTKRSKGRLTLRGPNGAGKSTLLSLFSEQTGDESFYLPSHFADLAFSSESLVTQSDGNRLLKAFEEISELKGVKFLLLDEWDANLDSENLIRIHAAIDRLAEERLVIESRHRT